jgi:hypothetical protein
MAIGRYVSMRRWNLNWANFIQARRQGPGCCPSAPELAPRQLDGAGTDSPSPRQGSTGIATCLVAGRDIDGGFSYWLHGGDEQEGQQCLLQWRPARPHASTSISINPSRRSFFQRSTSSPILRKTAIDSSRRTTIRRKRSFCGNGR